MGGMLGQGPSSFSDMTWDVQQLPQPEVYGSSSTNRKRLLAELDEMVVQNGVLWRVCNVGSGHQVCQSDCSKAGSQQHVANLRCCYWPRITQDLKECAETCLLCVCVCVCAKNDTEMRAPLLPIAASYPFEVVGVEA